MCWRTARARSSNICVDLNFIYCLMFNIAGRTFAGNSTVDGSTRETGAMDRIGGPRERDPPIFVLGLDLLFRCLHFASGSGRSWNFNTLGFVPLPPSMWKASGYRRSPTVPCPCSRLSDCRCAHPKNPAGCLRRSMISISIAMLLGPSTFFLSMINPCAAFSGSVRPRLPLLRTMFLAQCRHRLAKRWSVHR
jgi:hypothetical protein